MSAPGPQSGTSVALVGGTVHTSPHDRPIPDGVVLVEHGRIGAVGAVGAVRVPTSARIIDCEGLSIAAGFWNSHVHLFESMWAEASTISAEDLSTRLSGVFGRFGFTSLFDTGSPWNNTRIIRDRIRSGEVRGPTIRSTGEAMRAPETMPSDEFLVAMGFMPFPAPEITNAAEARAASRALIAAGVDGIKVHLSRPDPPNRPVPASALPSAVAEARHAGIPVFVHPADHDDVVHALNSGADVIAHTTPASGPWDDRVVGAMIDHRAALTPTLMLWRPVEHEGLVHLAVDQLRAFASAGGEVLFGTDLGAVGPDPEDEYVLMVGAGMTFPQILAALTTAPARRFTGSSRAGRVLAGEAADLVVFAGDPTADIRVLADVRYTLQAGETVFQAIDVDAT